MSGNKVFVCCSGNSEATRDADSTAKLRLMGKMQHRAEHCLLAELTCWSLYQGLC